MAETYFPFGSMQADRRKYLSQHWADFFHKFLSNGVFHSTDSVGTEIGLEVTKTATLQVTVAGGEVYDSAMLNGRMYTNTTPLPLAVQSSPLRYDRVVLQLDTEISAAKRYIKAMIKQGTDSAPPELTRAGHVYELSLAQLVVYGGEVTSVIDEREDTDFCGLVSSMIEPIAQREAHVAETTETDDVHSSKTYVDSLLTNAVSVYNLSGDSHTLAAATDYAIPFTGQRFITNNSMHDTVSNNTRLVAPIDGVYLVTGVVAYLMTVSSGNILFNGSIFKNGASYIGFQQRPNADQNGVRVPVTMLVDLQAGEYLELVARHGNVDTTAVLITSCFFCMSTIGLL